MSCHIVLVRQNNLDVVISNFSAVFVIPALFESWCSVSGTSPLPVLGREYDKDGVLKPWWALDVIARFNESAQCFVEQYNKYTSYGEHVSIRSFC